MSSRTASKSVVKAWTAWVKERMALSLVVGDVYTTTLFKHSVDANTSSVSVPPILVAKG